jgi:hypothetical protein
LIEGDGPRNNDYGLTTLTIGLNIKKIHCSERFKMIFPRKTLVLLFGASFIFFASCNKTSTPSSNNTGTNYLYLTVTQTSPACALTLSLSGPTTFQDILGTTGTSNSLISFNYTGGSYQVYFNGASDGVTHNLSGAETIKCNPSAGCGSWSYSVAP